MPTYRKLYTKTLDSLDVADMPDDFCRLLWVLLPLGLCAEGRGLDNPRWVQSHIFPLRTDVTMAMIDAALDWYAAQGMIQRYQVAGRRYFCIPTWHKYQGNTSREARSEYPPPPGARAGHEQVTTDSCSDADADADADAQGDADAAADAAAPAAAASAAAAAATPSGALAAFSRMSGGAVNATTAGRLAALAGECEAHRRALPRGAPGAGVTGAGWVEAAIDEAVASTGGRVNLRYLESIASRWRAEGFRAPRQGGAGARAGPPPAGAAEPAGYAGLREWLSKEGWNHGDT